LASPGSPATPVATHDARMTDACCAAGTLVFKQDTPEAGAVQTLGGDLEAYVVGAGTTALILGTDIFGFAAPNTRANADMMAAALGCMVVVPDHFRGTDIKKYLDGAEFTPAAIGGFLAKHGTVEATKADLLDKVVPFAAAAGAMRLLYMGFCWGGKIALALVADEQLAPKFAAAGGLHASLKDPDGDVQRAAAAKVPLMLLQAGNDADVRPVHEALQAGPLAGKHLVRTYYDMVHGWAGARGDRSDPRVAAAVKSALQTSVDFFSWAP